MISPKPNWRMANILSLASQVLPVYIIFLSDHTLKLYSVFSVTVSCLVTSQPSSSKSTYLIYLTTKLKYKIYKIRKERWYRLFSQINRFNNHAAKVSRKTNKETKAWLGYMILLWIYITVNCCGHYLLQRLRLHGKQDLGTGYSCRDSRPHSCVTPSLPSLQDVYRLWFVSYFNEMFSFFPLPSPNTWTFIVRRI